MPPTVTAPLPALVVKYGSIRRVLQLDDAYEDICRRWNLQIRSTRDLVTPCVLVGPIGLDEINLQSLWEKVVLSEAKNEVVDALRIIAPETDDFALLGNRASSIRLRLKGSGDPVPLKSMGDGMNRLFGLGMALACAKDGTLLVDEIENGIHWSALPEVWKFIVKSDGPLPNDGRHTAWQVCCRIASPRGVDHFLAEYGPPVLDPFAGGGSIPLEAQRLGLRAHASDLNPVPVLINKALIEIPPKFAGMPPVNVSASVPGSAGVPPAQECGQDARAPRNADARAPSQSKLFEKSWPGASGLAEDVRYYGKWMRDEAEKRIGHLYPKVKVTQEMVDAGREDLKPYLGKELTVIAWLWARTVPSPDPSVGGKHIPLVRSFWLSKKKGKEAYVQPIVDRTRGTYDFKVKVGKPGDGFDPDKGTKPAGRGSNFECLLSKTTIDDKYIKEKGQSEGLETKLMAIVCEGFRARIYLNPTEDMEFTSKIENPDWKPEFKLIGKSADQLPLYGMKEYWQLFTPRQLTALTTFSDLVAEARTKVLNDALGARASRPHSFVHNRGYLPHWEAGERPQAVSFRLADSLPGTLLDTWKDELDRLPEKQKKTERRRRIENALDAGQGKCHLHDPSIASIVMEALLYFDGTRYRLHTWCIMPNHVHVIFTPLHGYSLSSILHSWKSFTAKKANKILGAQGVFWQEEYFDRMIRDEKHFAAACEYVEKNPVRAGLCATVKDWRFSSASSHAGEKRAGRPRSQEERPLAEGGTGPWAYADAVATYLGLASSRVAIGTEHVLSGLQKQLKGRRQ